MVALVIQLKDMAALPVVWYEVHVYGLIQYTLVSSTVKLECVRGDRVMFITCVCNLTVFVKLM